MKVILSRKGFDSRSGGCPSPILPDGILLSLPIPSKKDCAMHRPIKYTDLIYEGKSLYHIIKELHPRNKIQEKWVCHLDPDIKNYGHSDDWKPLFGQENGSLTHLQKHHIDKGDLFLFFGWFKEAEIRNDQLRFDKHAPHLHVLWGYLQIGEMFNQLDQVPSSLRYHPHATLERYSKNNCIYKASEKFSQNTSLKGSGCFKYHPSLVLTKNGYPRTRWEVPSFFNDISITYHSEKSFKKDYFQSASIGQEFILSEVPEVEEWAKSIIEHGVKS